jgi:hypothetical protein
MSAKMKFISLFVGVLLLALNVSVVSAAAPAPVHIVVNELYFDGTPEPFTASGAAVDNGLICETGTVADIGGSTNDPRGPFRIIWALKRFDCGNGTFDLEMVVRLDLATHDTTARWRIVGGTDAYSSLKGQGSLVGISNDPAPGIVDTYDGWLH